MNPAITKWVKRHTPNIPVLRKTMTKAKLKSLKSHLLSESEIAAGEHSEAEKAVLVKKYAEKWPKYTAELTEKMEKYFRELPEALAGRDEMAVRTDVLFNGYAYGFMPDEYFFYHLEGKSREEKDEYISDLQRYIYTYMLNDIVDLDIFYDKFRTYEKFSEYFKRDAICIEKKQDYKKFVKYVEAHPVFVRKSVHMSRGQGVSLVDSKNCGMTLMELFDSLIAQGKQMLEEPVVQSEEMMRMNPSSVNTVRCPTFRTKRGVELGPCRFRTGQHGSFVDNAGSGGILTGVDPKTGVVNSVGWDEYCRKYEKHPDSGLTFLGYQMPEWELLEKTVKEMAEKMPGMGYISWDMAHTDQGWVIIEANGAGQFIGSQIVCQHGMKKEILEQLDGMLNL